MSGPLLTTILQAIVGAAGLGGAALLLAQARRRPSLAALAALLAVLGLQMVANLGDTAGWPLIGRLRPVLGMTYGPLLALFVLAISRHRRPLLARRWPHLLGPALGLLLVLAHAPTALVANAIFASLGAYLLAAHRILIRHRTVIALTRTDAESASLVWAERIIGLGFAVLILNVSDFWIGYGTVTRWQPVSTAALYGALLVLVGVVSVRAVRYPESTGAISAEEEDTLPVAEATPFSAEDDRAARQLAAEVGALLTERRLFLDPQLTLAAVARRLGRAPRELSAAVNIATGAGFPELVSRLRIAEAQRLLADPQRNASSILELLHEAGFSSKSTFNDAFRRLAGTTPSAWREAALRDRASAEDHVVPPAPTAGTTTRTSS